MLGHFEEPAAHQFLLHAVLHLLDVDEVLAALGEVVG